MTVPYKVYFCFDVMYVANEFSHCSKVDFSFQVDMPHCPNLLK